MAAPVVAVSGASGKTGYRIAEELLAVGVQPRLLLRSDSAVPTSLSGCEQVRLNIANEPAPVSYTHLTLPTILRV